MSDDTSTPPPPPSDRGHAGPQVSWTPPPRPRRRRRGVVATLLAACLVLGGAAGVGAALTWQQVSGDEESGAPLTGGPFESTPTSDSGDGDSAEQTAPGSVADVVDDVIPSVVNVHVRTPRGTGAGSGVILTENGHILTNYHVVEAAVEGRGRISVGFNEGTAAPARVVGADPVTDIAVLQAVGVQDLNLDPASFGDSSELEVGQPVVAVGSPFGLDSTVTKGIVSALGRAVTVGGGNESTTYPAIQTDAAINPGNSGGPLVNLNGDVVGINSAIRTTPSPVSGSGGSIGLGFAIPINIIKPLVEQILAGKQVTHARLGVLVSKTPPDLNPRAAIGGALVRKVFEGSAAAEAGLQAGDVIIKVDGDVIAGPSDLIATILTYRPGDKATITFIRDGEAQQVTLRLESD